MSRRKEYDSVEDRDDFQLTVDGKDWDYRDPRNKQTATYFDKGNREVDNPNSYKMSNPLYDYSYGAVRDAGKELGISNVDEPDEVNRLIEYMQKPKTEEAPEPVEEESVRDKHPKTNNVADNNAELSTEHQQAQDLLETHKQNLMSGGLTGSIYREKKFDAFKPEPNFRSNDEVRQANTSSEIDVDSFARQQNAMSQSFLNDFRQRLFN